MNPYVDLSAHLPLDHHSFNCMSLLLIKTSVKPAISEYYIAPTPTDQQ